MNDHEEQQIIQKLKAQRNGIKPQRQLLHSLLLQLPPAGERSAFVWMRFTIPATIAMLVFGIFVGTQIAKAPVASPIPTSPPLSVEAIEAEQQHIEEVLAYDEFFEDELHIQEVDAALGEF